MSKRGKLAAALEETAHDPKVRLAAASAVAASGAIATGKVIRERVAERRRRRARRYRLEPGETPMDGIARIARGQLDLATGLLEGHDGGGHGSEVHEARKALKRLRAMLRVSRGLLGTERYRHENVTLRDTGRALSGARDAEVLLETFDHLVERYEAELSAPAWPRLREALAASARNAHGAGDGAAAGAVDSLAAVRDRVATWPLPQAGGPEAFADGLKRIYRRGRRALRAAEQELSTENLHELRKRAKDLWHGAQLLRPAAPKRMKQLARRAHRVSDLLGDDHDLSVLMDSAHAHPELLDAAELERLAALIERRREILRREALARAARLYRRKPRRLAAAVASGS